MAALIEEWDADTDMALPHEQIAICVPTNSVRHARNDHALVLKPFEPEHRALVPRWAVNSLRDRDPVRYRHELQRARSLLFVAATRARDSVDVFWHGKPSPFLDDSWVASEASPS
ncbi:superfamily I DNA/RNA helicase [Streptomyces africanus]|uniref:Superfamily I DNA/RNA helicase n=1 Tax=Streptomyces africanus TaxID=231024 RepID=A0ABU0QX20_9ACTN|nr:superfamily I DNA/RNA helicase [Streptomyces africanus]